MCVLLCQCIKHSYFSISIFTIVTTRLLIGCNYSRDIIGHHIPTLMALTLAIPLWSNYATLRQFESLTRIIDSTTGDNNEQQLRTHFINSCTLGSGFAYISSLNEAFMCFQRVEMSLQNVTSFRDIPNMKKHFFTSKVAVCVELCYKLCFFWGISLFACKACCDFDKALYDSLVSIINLLRLTYACLNDDVSLPACALLLRASLCLFDKTLLASLSHTDRATTVFSRGL